jgi:hypothetical protein
MARRLTFKKKSPAPRNRTGRTSRSGVPRGARGATLSPEDVRRFVFIDETWASTTMVRRFGRSLNGQRLIGAVPHGHWKTTTFVAALRHEGLTAPVVDHYTSSPFIWVSFQVSQQGSRALAGVE